MSAMAAMPQLRPREPLRAHRVVAAIAIGTCSAGRCCDPKILHRLWRACAPHA